MATYWDVIIFSLVGGLFSLVGGAILLSRKKTALALASYATPFAAGALIAAVFTDLLYEGVEISDPRQVFSWAMAGIVIFYFAERFLHWFHHHHSETETSLESDEHHHASVPLIIAGDTIHNVLDGVVIAAAFLVSVPTGIVTAIVVAAHEIPQEIGDFGLLLHKGLSRAKVLVVNALSALATVLAAVLTFSVGSAERLPMGILIGLSAGFLLYIALSDIMPELHRHANKSSKLFSWQPLLLVLGVVVVSFMVIAAHNLYEHDESESSHSESSGLIDTNHA